MCNCKNSGKGVYEEKLALANQLSVLGALPNESFARESCTAFPQELLNTIRNMNVDRATFLECPSPDQLQ